MKCVSTWIGSYEDMVRKDFAGPGPYPIYVLQRVSKLAPTSTNPFPAIALNMSTGPLIRPSPSIPTPPLHPNLRTQSRRPSFHRCRCRRRWV
ncbi:hypothetical protein PILCRDRAFT_828447 [Piloderma croceum F 1598]|uniref:Uncharacterized protein n=1 Tax=Piloderma croceum (strain F 1598) TaxID=765440 RepID=A0A0C3F2P2_PILCF|nr:hypothetical protein PILCRDRAFT_828447 [Piloderma croceum F 1598]